MTRLEKLLKGHLSFGSLKDLQKLSSDDIYPGTSVNISQDKSNSKKKKKGWSGSLEKACLKALLMDPSSGIQSLSTRQIHQSCIEFKSMSFNKFSDRLARLRRGCKSEKKALEQELAEFKKHKKALSNSILPSGTIYWPHHPAKKQLDKDFESGVVFQMKPKELWSMRDVYHNTPGLSAKKFGKHVHSLKSKRLAEPFWQKKRQRFAKDNQWNEEVKDFRNKWKQQNL